MTSLLLRLAAAAPFAATALITAPAAAESGRGTMAVSATVVETCSVSADPVQFGSVDLSGGDGAAAAGQISVACSSGTEWSVSADGGGTRTMNGSGGSLAYALYTDPGRTMVWGDGSAGTAVLRGLGTGARQVAPIHAALAPGQREVRAGIYSDVVTVTITY